jgi:hypothetical protein
MAATGGAVWKTRNTIRTFYLGNGFLWCGLAWIMRTVDCGGEKKLARAKGVKRGTECPPSPVSAKLSPFLLPSFHPSFQGTWEILGS